jgi:hypothetical protein
VEFAQYTSVAYIERLDDLGIDPSVGSKGDAYDCEHNLGCCPVLV